MKPSERFRIMTYNVHGCIGRDGQASPYRISEVIATFSPDVAALQELDVNRIRTGVVDQPRVIAGDLNMYFHFNPSFGLEEEQYGNAVLSRYPVKLIKAGALPSLPNRSGLETRSVLWVSVEIYGTDVQIMNTHLGLNRSERLAQMEAITGLEWMKAPGFRPPFIICGDLNCGQGSRVYKTLAALLRDVQCPLHGRPRKTWPSMLPLTRLDHIFASGDLNVLDCHVPHGKMLRYASDHLPLIAELGITSKGGA
ncbi:MAG: endonuclease/exonuclease/phosphatase family protein [Actinomycetota bacterium]|nr:endonuclease/exonuclease/phosphatase family protein [Actinomycetota bacterium]